MQVTIKDSLIKKMLSQHIVDCLEKRNPKLVNEIMADANFQDKLARELSKYFNEEQDIIGDLILEVPIPQLTKAVRSKYATAE